MSIGCDGIVEQEVINIPRKIVVSIVWNDILPPSCVPRNPIIHHIKSFAYCCLRFIENNL